MPLYEYQCQECAEVHEVVQRYSDPLYTICPSCGGGLKKLISAPAIQFKGSGFYITDYGKGNGGGSKSGEGAAARDSKSEGSSAGSETSSPAKTEGPAKSEGPAPAGTKS